MLIIERISEKNVRPYTRLPALIVTNKGTRHFGILSGVENRRLILNDFNIRGKTVKSAERKKARNRQQTDKIARPSFETAPLPIPSAAVDIPFPQRMELELGKIAYILIPI